MKEFNSSGDLIIQDKNINHVQSPVNKKYVDTALEPKADKTYVDQAVPVRILTGVGFPEGKVEAPVGSIYTDTAATNGAIRWLKTSGTGTTGWTVEYGDTGWRVYDSVSGGITSGRVLIRRQNSTVVIHFDYLTPTSTSTNISLGRMPAGFRGSNIANRWIMLNNFGSTPDIYTGNISTLGYANIYGPFTQRPELNGTAQFITGEQWPASLPGVPL